MVNQKAPVSNKQPWWKAWGPSAMIAAAIVGPGTVTTVSVAGADHGYKVAWVLVIACLIGYVIQRPVIKWTIATNTSIFEGIRSEMSSLWAKILFIGLWIGALAFQAGNFIGGALALKLFLPNVPVTLWVALLSAMALVVAWIGVYKVLENVNRTIIILLVVAFCMTGISAIPKADGFLRSGFSFQVPGGDFMLVLALVATILVPNTLVSLSGFTKQKYENEPELEKKEKIFRSYMDLKINFIMMGIIALAILISAGTAIYGTGATIEGAGDMAAQLTPILGQFAGVFFALGLFAAGFSSGLFNLTVQPMLFGEAFNVSENPKSSLNRAIIVITAVIPIVLVFLFGGSPVQLIVTAQALNGLLLPLLAVTIFILTNKKQWMGDFKNSVLNNFIFILIIIIVFLLAIKVFVDLF